MHCADRLFLGAFTALSLVACADPGGSARQDARSANFPERIVSLDFCADQYVLKLVDRDRILALSPHARADFSYMRRQARGIATVRPSAEDVLLLKPDLIVRSYGGGPWAAAFFERAGVPVLTLGWAGDIAGVKAVIAETAAGLGARARARRILEEMDRRLARLAAPDAKETALYITPAGVTTGPGSLIDEVLRKAGYANFETAPGWRAIPLERLAYEQPDVVAAAFFDADQQFTNAWNAIRHPVAQSQLQPVERVFLKSAWTSCGGWFVLDAVEALAEARKQEARKQGAGDDE